MYPDPQDPTIPATARHEQVTAMHHQHGRQLERRVERRARASPETSEDAYSFAWLQLLMHTSIDLDAPSWRALGGLTQTATREAWRLEARRRRDGLLDHVARSVSCGFASGPPSAARAARRSNRSARSPRCQSRSTPPSDSTTLRCTTSASLSKRRRSAPTTAQGSSPRRSRFFAHAHELVLRGAEIVDADVLAPSPRSGVALVVACVLKTLGPLGEDPERARESAKVPAARHTPPQNSESCTTSGSVGAGSGSLPSLKRLGHVTPSRLTSWASRRRSSFGA